MEIYSIYNITNNVTGRVYVGRTTNPASRFGWHRSHLAGGRHNIEDLQTDYDRLGEGAFTFRVVCTVSDWGEAAQVEKRLIREANNPYNRLGNPNYVHHATVRAQARAAA